MGACLKIGFAGGYIGADHGFCVGKATVEPVGRMAMPTVIPNQRGAGRVMRR